MDEYQASVTRITFPEPDLFQALVNDFFELAEYDWTPRTREDAPSMYLYELAHWWTTVVDSLVIKDVYKDEVNNGKRVSMGCLSCL